MKALLKSNGLSDNAIKIYLEGLGRFPYTFSEIRNIIPNLSEDDVKQILDELIAKQLILLVNPKYSESLPHYITVPPFAAILNSITGSGDDIDAKDSKKNLTVERFRETLYQDIENITGDLIDAISKPDSSIQTTEILTEVEDNVKKFAQVILNEVIGLISPLKLQTMVDGRDFNKLINSVKQKISDSEEIVTNMFTQFRDIVKEMATPDKSSQIEAFKVFIRRLGESFEKIINEIPIGPGSISSDKTELIKKSLNNILTSYINVNKVSVEKFWNINSYEKIKEIISLLSDKCTDKLTIIVPNIKTFIPLEKLELDYSEDLSLEKNIITKKIIPKKPGRKGTSITKKQKKEIEDKLDLTAKKVKELKGFELSHDIAEVLSLISEVNPESAAIDSIQGWLNRLLVIRKHLDSNTHYLLLENIEKWKKNYSKVKKKEEEPEKELIDELKEKTSEEKPSSIGLQLQLISSESHDNKYAVAFANKANTEYLQLNNNNIIAILGDNSYLILGVFHKTSIKPTYEISGFFTTYSPMLEIFKPLIEDIKNKAKHPKEIEINRGFNEIIENINDYSGRKISKRLKRLIDVAFEKDGISLDILELKLLMGKLEKSYQPLDDEMKEYVINELNKLNKKFSTLELIYPPEFRPPILEEETEGELEVEITSSEIEPLDPDKVDNLFELLIDKIDDLKGVEIGQQIDKFIEVILKLQGYSEIIEWKKSLSTVDGTLEEPFKEKIIKDLLSWKKGILQQALSSAVPIKEESTELYGTSQQIMSKQETASSIFEEEYISPGLAQSQFEVEGISTTDEQDKIDPEIEMKEFFNKIQANLGELSGTEISKLLQNIVDIILETEGYSMALKGVKDWISKLRMIRTPLETEIREDFKLELLKLKQKYSTDDDETNLDFSPSFERIEETVEERVSGNGETLIDKFNHLIQNAPNLNGNELSENLQDISDIVLQSHGAVALNVIRQWISKLRSIKEPLEDEIKDEFLVEIENWKEKFA